MDGYSLEEQKRRLLEYVKTHPELITKEEWIYSDTHTGSDLNREGLLMLLDDVKDGKYDAVLVWKIDRLSRSLKHLLTIFEDLKAHEVSFVSVQENIDFRGAIGSLIFQIFGAIAQFERELIKGRTMMGKIGSAELGNYTGSNVPYGYLPVPNPGKKGKKIDIIPEEKKWVEQIYDWYIYDGLGDGLIAKKLTEKKVPRYKFRKDKEKGIWVRDPLGTSWTDRMVTPILSNPIYHGEYVANTKDETGNVLPQDKWTCSYFPACVSDFTFQQAQVIRENKMSGRTATNYLLSGKMKDMTLQKPLTFVGAKRTKGGFSYRRKQFKKNNHHYPVFEVPGLQIEDYVWGKIMLAMHDPEIFIKQYLSKEYTDKSKIKNLEMQLNSLRQRKVSLEIGAARIEHGYDTGFYDEEKAQSKLAVLRTESGEVEAKIQESEDELSLMSSVDMEVKKLRDASKQVKYRLEHLDPRNKRILCNLFVERVEMLRTKIGARWKTTANVCFRFNPEKFVATIKAGRTQNGLIKGKKDSSNPKSDVNGGSGGI